MVKFCIKEIWLLVLVFEMGIQATISATFEIYRGFGDRFSSDIVTVPKASICGNDYCHCHFFRTSTYDINKRTGECVRDDEIIEESGCQNFSDFPSSVIPLSSAQPFEFSVPTKRDWRSTEFTRTGDYTNWLPTENNPGNFSVRNYGTGYILKINDPTKLALKFSGTLLRLQISCSIVPERVIIPYESADVNQTCLLLKVEGPINITKATSLHSTTPSLHDATTTSTSSTTTPSSQRQRKKQKRKKETDKITTNPSQTTTKIPAQPILTTKISTIPSPTTKIPSEPKDRRESEEGDLSDLVSILAPTLLSLLLIILLIAVLLHRKRRRFARPKRRNTSEIAAQNPTSVVAELAERSQILSSNDDSQPSRESRVCETPAPKERQHNYQYIYANDGTSNAPLPLNHTYDYASVGRGYEPLNPALGTVSVNEGYQPLNKGPGTSKDRVSDGDDEPRKNLSKNEEASVDEGYEPLTRSQGRAQNSADDGYQPLKKGHTESVENGLVEAGYESLNNERRIQEQFLVDQSYQPLSRSRGGPEETDEQEELCYVGVVG